jgi:hypothetical protein
MGALAGLIAFGIAYAMRHGGDGWGGRGGSGSKMASVVAEFSVHPGGDGFTVQSSDGTVRREVDLVLLVDDVPRPLALGRSEIQTGGGGWTGSFTIALGDRTVDASLAIAVDRVNGALALDLRVAGADLPEPHTFALRAEMPSEGQVVFVSGVGELADRGTVNGTALVVDADPHPIGVVSTQGALTVTTTLDEGASASDLRVAVATPVVALGKAPDDPSGDHPRVTGDTTGLRVAVGESSMRAWRALYALTGAKTARVKGVVTGTHDRAHVFGRDALGAPQVRANAAPDGTFELEVPDSVVQWYAAIDAERSSALASFTPGGQGDLVLDVSPGGALRVTVVDADTKNPVTARLLVTGIKGTIDPSFGPDFRASGAGPLIDALRGEVSTPLPSGKYRVAATRGIEWSIDDEEVEITAGRTVDVHLEPRHVVPTPGVVGCDLHVHSRPSFDSPVSVEDRVLSLVAAGVDFAVPTEHNVVGDYSSAIDVMDLAHEIASVTGVEVTTLGGGFGHFGVFPYPKGEPVPPYKHVSMANMVKAARGNDPKRYFQVNHPRLPKGIGYFTVTGFFPKMTKATLRGRFDFDGIEVFNGYDVENVPRVEEVLRDYHTLLNLGYRHVATGSSDAHRIQYHWAGYPRTMVALEPGGSDVVDERFDPLAVVAAIKKGHATVTSGPIIELALEETGADGVVITAHPGDEILTPGDPIRGHLRVRAAPWVDVTSVQVIVNGKMVQSFPVPSRPTRLGREEGALEEVQKKTVRFDQDLEIPIGPDNAWVQIVVRGERKMDDALPFMPVQPFAFTNPIWITRNPVPPPPLIVQGPPLKKKDGAAPVPPGHP